jgi:DNA-binding NtrC family response regulator
MDILRNYNWPGNVRELENAVERAVVICRGDEIRPEDFPFSIDGPGDATVVSSIESVQKNHIKKILEQTDWNISRAAGILQVDRVTLYNKIKKYDLKKP